MRLMLYVRLYTDWHILKESTFDLPRKCFFFKTPFTGSKYCGGVPSKQRDSLGFVYFLFILLSALQK